MFWYDILYCLCLSIFMHTTRHGTAHILTTVVYGLGMLTLPTCTDFRVSYGARLSGSATYTHSIVGGTFVRLTYPRGASGREL